MSKDDRDERKDPWWNFLFIAMGIVAFQIIAGMWIHGSFDTPTERGTYGDMFGAVNTLFSGLAFAGVIYAIILQREELRLQREELRLTREELAKSAEAQEKSAELIQRQLDLQLATVESSLIVTAEMSEAEGERLELRILVENRGGTAFNVSLHAQDDRLVRSYVTKTNDLKQGDTQTFFVRYAREECKALWHLLIRFEDIRGATIYREFDFSPSRNRLYERDRK